MKRIVTGLLAVGLTVCSRASEAELADSVDLFTGTAGTGHVFPGPCRPFGLVQPSPDTGNGNWRYCGGYAWDDRAIKRFSQTHVNGAGQAGLGDIGLLPFVGGAPTDPATLDAPFSKSNEVARLGSYSVVLESGVKVEIAAGRRVARYRISFPSDREGGILLDFPYGLYRQKGYLPHLTTTCRVEQVSLRRFRCQNHSEVWAPRDIASIVVFSRDAERIVELPRTANARGPVYAALFKAGTVVEVSIAVSARSLAGAERNLAAEGSCSFETLVGETRREWNELLGRVDTSGEPPGVRRMIATSVYRLCIQPNDISDAGEPPRYSTFSLWDTFRDAHPLYEKLVPERVPGFVRSLLDHSDRWGYLPQWELWGRETGGMIGSHAVPVVVSAVEHGFGGFDREKAHGNEPCHHVIGLYRLIGRDDKADRLERRVCGEFYRPTPDGLCGNDDCGQMSAWYLRRLTGVPEF